MGLFNFFSKDAKLSPRAIAKQTKAATNQFAQPDVRQAALHKLYEDGTPDAVRGLLRRFTMNASGGIADEEEKHWVEECLVELGEVAIEPIKEYIRTEKNITYPIRSLLELQPASEVFEFLLEVLDKYGPEDYRSFEVKLQIIYVLQEKGEVSVLERLLPYLEDHADDVRLAVIDMLESFHKQKLIPKEAIPQIAEALGAQVLEDEFSPRIQRRVADFLAQAEWRIPGEKGEIVPFLQEEFFLDKKRYVRVRFAKK